MSVLGTIVRFKGLISVSLFVGILAIVIMVPLSFSYVDKNKLAFKKNTASNSVDLSKVYTPGRYFWGLGHNSVQFPSTLQRIALDGKGLPRLSIFTDGGQTMTLSCILFYQINASTLANVYRKFGLSYHNQIVAIAQAEIRNVAPTFSLSEYLTNRENVSRAIYESLSAELADKAFVAMPYRGFHLNAVTLPSTVLRQKSTIFTTTQSLLTQNFSLQSSLIRLNTSKIVAEIQNEGNATLSNATAVAQRLVTDAVSRQVQLLNTERGRRIADLVSALAITNHNTTKKLILYTSIIDAQIRSTLVATDRASPLINIPGN